MTDFLGSYKNTSNVGATSNAYTGGAMQQFINTGGNASIGSGSSTSFMPNMAQGFQMGSQAIGAVADLYGMWQARQNYKLSKEAFRFNKQLSTINLNNQANLTNERLATRQGVRANNDPNAMPVDQFMAKYKVSGIGG